MVETFVDYRGYLRNSVTGRRVPETKEQKESVIASSGKRYLKQPIEAVNAVPSSISTLTRRRSVGLRSSKNI